jgi:type II restriction enzyme
MNDISSLLEQWRLFIDGSYHSWFLWEERLKNFRSIRQGVKQVVLEIGNDTFGALYKGSSLEMVLASVAEQKQIFRGADHAFVWKPKLRIPDIYENKTHQKSFGRFLELSLSFSGENDLIEAINFLDDQNIKGLGPAVANLLYFLHPTLAMPSNTKILNGFNILTGSKAKLGRWSDYLAMRKSVIEINAKYSHHLSNDLGAIAALLFDIGDGRLPIDISIGVTDWPARKDEIQKTLALSAAKRIKKDSEISHNTVQGWLKELGIGLGFDVWIALNDHSRDYKGKSLASGCLAHLPPAILEHKAFDIIKYIDVIWFKDGQARAAFEVEHSTSIYSGLLRLSDLYHGDALNPLNGLFLVAPDERETQIFEQLARPCFLGLGAVDVKYIPYSAIDKNRDAILKFGDGLKAMDTISKSVNTRKTI